MSESLLAEAARSGPTDGSREVTALSTEQARKFRGTHTEGRSPEELRELVSHVGAELELAPAEDIVEWAVATFGGRFCITSSMGDAVLAHVAARVAPGVDVVFLDTGYHFAETIGTADAVGATMDVNLIPITPVADRGRAGRRSTARSSTGATPTCAASCARSSRSSRRCVQYDAWATGLRRAETHNRAIAPVVGLGRQEGQGQGLPARPVDRRRRRPLHRRARRAGQPPRLRRLPLHRLCALHPQGRPRRRPAQRALGRHPQDRVRDPLVTRPANPHQIDSVVGHPAPKVTHEGRPS